MQIDEVQKLSEIATVSCGWIIQFQCVFLFDPVLILELDYVMLDMSSNITFV